MGHSSVNIRIDRQVEKICHFDGLLRELEQRIKIRPDTLFAAAKGHICALFRMMLRVYKATRDLWDFT